MRTPTTLALAGLMAVSSGLPALAAETTSDAATRPVQSASLVAGYVQSFSGMPMLGLEYAWRVLPQSEVLAQAMSSGWFSHASLQFRHVVWHHGAAGVYVSGGPHMAVALASPGFGAGAEIGAECWLGHDWRLAGGIGGMAEVVPGWSVRPTAQLRFGKAW